MKPIRTIGTAVMLSLLGAATPALAQQGRSRSHPSGPAQRTQRTHSPAPAQAPGAQSARGRHTPGRRQPTFTAPRPAQQPRPESRLEPRSPVQVPHRTPVQPRPETRRAQVRRPQVQPRPAARPQVRETRERQELWRQRLRNTWRQRRAGHFEREHRSWRARGGYHGYRIPVSYFNHYYGPTRFFRLYGMPFEVVSGLPRFQYGGYWFTLLDPYPEYWGDDWYRYDDVYVDYVDDGYYLFNRSYPGRPGLALSISL